MGRKLPVIVGQVFGKLTVTAGRDGRRVLCNCECGGTKYVHPRYLLDNVTRSCDDCKFTRNGHKMGALKPGDWIGALQAVKPIGKTKDGRIKWIFRCICGNTVMEIATEMKRFDGPTCGGGGCKRNGVIAVTLSRPSDEDKVNFWTQYCKSRGYKLYDIFVSPPKLVYDPGE